MPIDGNAERNNLLGTLLPDIINGFANDDTLRGSDGADTLNGGNDDDVLFAVNDPIDHDKFDSGTHDYTLFGDGQADVLNGESGDDQLVGDFFSFYDGGTGEDSAYVSLAEAASAVTFNYGGGSSVAYFFVMNGVNRGSMIDVEHVDLYGSAFNDVLSLASGDDHVQAFAGNDTVNGNAGNDELRGGDGNDSITGGTGRDTLGGGDGADAIDGGAENDKLFAAGEPDSYTSFDNAETDFSSFGNGAADTLSGGDGSDDLVGDEYTTYDGGSGGADKAYVSVVDAEAALTFTYGGSDGTAYTFFTGGAARGSVKNVENFVLYGTGFADNVVLHDGADRVQANGGNDVVDGRDGRDTLYGGDGADLLIGGESNDVLLSVAGVGDFSTFDDDSIDKDLFGDGAAETLDGGNGNDELLGDLYGTYFGGTGNDRAYVSFTEATAAMSFTYGGLEATPYRFMMGGVAQGYTYDIENFDIYGSVFGDVFNMHTGEDRIEGMGGNDTINGAEGDDVLRGGSGNDIIDGGLDNDELGGNVGLDTLNGGHGDDIIFALIEPQGYDRFDRSTIKLDVFGWHEQDILNGGDGNDWLIADYYALMDGGTGGDRAYVSLFDALSAVTFSYGGAANTPYSFVISGVSFGNIRNVENFDIYGSDFGDVLTLWEGDDNVQGRDGADAITGNGGNDQLRGGLGNDTALGGAGNDTLMGGADTDAMEGGEGDDVLFAALEPDDYDIFEDRSTDYEDHGDGAADTLSAGAGNDRLIGDHFAIYDGGTGNDRAYISLFEAPSGVTFNYASSNGTAYVFKVDGLNHGSVKNVEAFDLYGSEYGDNITLAGGNDKVQAHGGDDTVNGGSGNDILHGGDGNDRLNGGPGADTLEGGLGDDTYVNTTEDDLIVETAGPGSGRDTIEKSVSYTLDALLNIENLRLVGSAAINGTGNDIDNVITGNTNANQLTGGGGNDTLIGGGGADTMAGGTGNDTYGYAPGATIVELAGEGSDTVESAGTFSLAGAVNIENITLTGAGHTDATGDAGANRLAGNGGNNRIEGLSGLDTLSGGAGNDTLDGGSGADSMTGGLGDDSYYIDEAGDTVQEAADQGTDTVYTVLNHVLGANVENLRLLGSAGLSGQGNELNNKITGNAGANHLQGHGGNDAITGDKGQDTLDGGAGVDTMTGGDGSDIYYVDAGGDQTVEQPGGGNDTVISSVSRTLGLNLEALELAGSANLNGNGNALNNRIAGNGGNNKLTGMDGNDSLSGGGGDDDMDGGTGADTMTGGEGNDLYRVDGTADRTIESAGQGTDTVYSAISWTLAANVENLRLQGAADADGSGNADANQITGNGGANLLQGLGGNDLLDAGGGNDRLIGSTGDDTLAGGSGADTLNGGSGADVFRFATANAGTDNIVDFNAAGDRFDLSGGNFASKTENAGGTRLVHDGGVIIVQGVNGLTLEQWNALVLPSGGGLSAAAASHAGGQAGGYSFEAASIAALMAQPPAGPIFLANADFL